ncbi:hypothetical protein LV475_09920 [Guyparkeria hydrothermalis]|uniref:hypothetical protein n=1 Tax=Guyparkeria TaxID=2035712 RepID=UPI0010AC5F1E|nr:MULTISPECIES: hypothetical protein [Guyparkeria]MCL7751907.1 hypothetical protein [Guyparkeria hydrothermalis]TKA90048.1 hypothetical protein FAZ79_04135 [Guyparkeria sp. SB14A]
MTTIYTGDQAIVEVLNVSVVHVHRHADELSVIRRIGEKRITSDTALMGWTAHLVGQGSVQVEESEGPTFRRSEASGDAALTMPAWACLPSRPSTNVGFLVGDQTIIDFLDISVATLRRHAPDLPFLRRMGDLRVTSLVAIEVWLREPLMPAQSSHPVAKPGPGRPRQSAHAVH